MYLAEVLQNGHLFHDEDVDIIERENITLHIIRDLVDDPILNQYADKEIQSAYLKKMQSTEVVKELNASYGKRIYDQLGVNQFDWIVSRLKRKPETKAATLSLLLPDDPGPRIPCLTTLDYKLRSDQLFTKAFFRSQNALRAYGNFRSMFWLSGEFARKMNVQIGEMIIFVSNGHILKDDIYNAEEILRRATRH